MFNKTAVIFVNRTLQSLKLTKTRQILNLQKQNSLINFKRSLFSSNSLLAKVQFNLTDVGEGITEVVVKEWFVKEGDRVSQFDNICEVQSDKAAVTITSRFDGVVSKIYYNVDDVALVGKPLVDIETEEEVKENETSKEVKTEKEPKHEEKETIMKKEQLQNVAVQCTPAVRRLAKSKNIDLNSVKPTGKGGVITEGDVMKYLESKLSPTINENEEIVKFSSFQAAMFKTMTAALKIPHLLLCEEVSASRLLQLVKSKNSENRGKKITLTPFLLKAISNALKKYPILNSSINENSNSLTIKNYHNIGVAMDTAQGLAVPVIKKVQDKDIYSIAQELQRLSESGKQGVFKQEDISDGTFSVSNIGSIGGSYAGPVILAPQVAIVAFGSIKKLPRFNDKKEVVEEAILNLSISADHRVIDGATVANFLKTVISELENPINLL